MAQRGEQHHNVKLSEPLVRAMRYLYWVKCIDQSCLSKLYNRNSQTIHSAVNYDTWRHVKDTFTADQIIRELK